MIGYINSIRAVRKQGMARAEARLDAIVPFHKKFWFVRQVVHFQSVAKPSKALLGIADLQRAADEADAPPAGTGQVAHSLVGTLIIVTDHRVFRQLRIGAHHQDKRNVDFFDHLAQGRRKTRQPLS